jgi:hypothetical protein
MSDEMNEPKKSEHRKFVHDVANDITIIDGSLAKVDFLLKKAGKTEEDEELIKLTKARTRIKDIVTKLRTYREYIHAQEAATKEE